MLLLCRLDDRLIHGQVMAVWVRQLRIDQIIVVDDASANDDFARELMHAAMPAAITLHLCGLEDAPGIINTLATSDTARTLLLFKRVADAVAIHARFPLPHLNVGNLGMRHDRTLIWRSVAASESELDELRRLESHGVAVYLQMIPNDSKRLLPETQP
jgi:mannose/fructose/N-acetylgalactosamine-specific phosphotransferase system component IIB